MFVFALAADFGEGGPNVARTRALIEGFPVSPPDGVSWARAPHASAAVGRWQVVARDAHAGPTWDGDQRLLFSGDVRLYNRPELCAQLGVGVSDLVRSDLDLARLAFLAWGPDCAERLVGDFAFVVWDDQRRVAWALRDHLGVRPLVYSRLDGGVVLASDARQIRRLLERPGAAVSAEQVRDSLLEQVSDLRRTFFRDVHRVRPGHVATISAAGVSEKRYWAPPTHPATDRSYDQNLETLRELFARAVRDRLESDRPIVAHASGGFDSSTVLMAAQREYTVQPARPPLVMVSGVVPGFPADESDYMDAVAAEVSFPQIRWKIVEEGEPTFLGVSGAAPYLRFGPGGGPRADLEIAERQGAGILLTGLLGDEVWFAAGILRDFMRHGRLAAVARTIFRNGVGGVSRNELRDLGLSVRSPAAAARSVLRRMDPDPRPREWWGPRLRDVGRAAAEQIELPDVAWPSHVTCAVWAQLTHWRTSAVVEAMTDYTIDSGLEVRHPHADVRLIDFVLRVPWTQREHRGHHRRTGRDALGGLLPDAFRRRIAQRPWTEVWQATARRTLRTLAPYLLEGEWVSQPFVDRGIAKAMLRQAMSPRPGLETADLPLILRFGALEAWLRGLLD